ncbi:acyltransferase [Micromonospora acroterricola]|uniref:Acyltransferase n=1 Tax=Micromonospora acroterricola TaxID=2202421 RepID=A0A317D7H7_9ACTN|nr:acyltransferase [Micromonospora acroterricola]PWR09606.1 acyltransferase [Micromonospora acroterricola]
MLPSARQVARRAVTAVPLSNAYAGRANSFGFLRLCFAVAVVLAHTAVIGYARPLTEVVDVAGLGVAGFFGISGFLITRSARRSSLPRYLWHRALRIWPGLWVCLLFIGLVVAPAVWYAERGHLDGLWRHPAGVVNFLQANWWGGYRQQGIVDVFRDTPYGDQTRRSVLDGSLWTLSYEIFCYLIVAALAVVAVLRRARWLVLVAAVLVFGLLCWNQYETLRFGGSTYFTSGSLGPLPLLGGLSKIWFLRFGFMFLVGAVADLYSDKLPINDVLGIAALILTGWQTLEGHLFGPALLAYEYAILYLAVRLPRLLHSVGQKNDYSYGIYIYSFVVQQTLAWLGAAAWGFVGYFAVVMVFTVVLAFLSWHLVEKPALRFKDWTPRLRRSAPPSGGAVEQPRQREPERAPVAEPVPVAADAPAHRS